MLSAIAGAVEVIAYLSLGSLFTAHVTGNLVVIATLLASGHTPNLAQVLAVPVFVVALAVVWLIAVASGRHGHGLIRPLLTVQFVLLCAVLLLSVAFDVRADRTEVAATIAAVFAVAAMATQFALLRLAIPGAPSTAVMTGNLTSATLSMVDMVTRGRALMSADPERLRTTGALLVGFIVGGVAGAGATVELGGWSWVLAVALAGTALAVPWHGTVTRHLGQAGEPAQGGPGSAVV
jgi:uncharacterized membrane protein YoaK (UPF0700 family)